MDSRERERAIMAYISDVFLHNWISALEQNNKNNNKETLATENLLDGLHGSYLTQFHLLFSTAL